MGLYFAATGFGNKIAGSIGEFSQLEEYKGDLIATVDVVNSLTEIDTYKHFFDGEEIEVKDYPINQDMNISLKASIYLSENEVVFEDYENEGVLISDIIQFDSLNTRGCLKCTGDTSDSIT